MNLHGDRRVKRWIPLPEENTEADILGVATKVFAGASSPVIKKVASYVFASGRDLSALGDVATELRETLGHSDFSKATFKLVDQIIRENLFPSDTAFATEMEQARQRLPKGRKLPAPALPVEPDSTDPDEAEPLPAADQPESPASAGHSRRSGSLRPLEASQLESTDRNRLEPALTAH